MNVMSILDHSKVNGPGDRMVIWAQGCTKKCPGCYQPESWSVKGGVEISPAFLAYRVRQENPFGLTLSGGDPLEQPEELLSFLELIQPQKNFLPGGIICFTGFTIEEINANPLLSECLLFIDLLIEGRYIKELRSYSGLHGSSNQRFIWNENSDRGRSLIQEDSVVFDQDFEVYSFNHSLFVTGFPDIDKEVLSDLGLRF